MGPGSLRVVPKEYDGWKLEGLEQYSPEKFYTGASNKHDHAARINLYVRPELLAEIQETIGSKIIPEYRSFQDFNRDALHHRMEFLRKIIMQPRWDQLVKADRRRAVIARMEREMAEMTAEVASAEEVLRAARFENDNDTITEIIEQYEDQLDDIREPFRSKIVTLINIYKPKS